MTPAQAPAPAHVTHEAGAEGVIQTDALVIGAGPAGLYQVFQLGLLEIQAHVVDALPYPGGQLVELYPDKPIYDIPGVPVCSGRELAQSLLRQIEPFAVPFHLGQTLSAVARQADGRFLAETRRGTRFLTRTLIIAAGVGAFEPRRIPLEALAAFEGTQVFHQSAPAAGFAGRHLVIVGGDDAALAQAIVHASEGPARAAGVTLVHRRDAFQAEPERVEAMRALCAQGAMHLKIGQVTGLDTHDGRLSALQVTGPDASTALLPLDALLVMLGVSPRLGPIAEWGLALERKQLVVDTERFATSVPGIFAVGDVVTYPGKKKLIVSGFHEAVLAAYGAAALVFPERGPIPLEYTTTSSRLHRVLGV